MEIRPATATTRTSSAAMAITAAILKTVIGAALLAVASQVLVPLPFTPVPLSLGTLAAMGLGVFLGPKLGVAAAALYAVAGAAGLPVFAGMQAGLMTASFGYVIGYIIAAGIVGAYVRRERPVSLIGALAISVSASAAILCLGTLWLIVAVGMSVPAAIAAGVVPFIIGDLIKSSVVAGTVYAFRAGRQR